MDTWAEDEEENPRISYFYGIIVKMYPREPGRHVPHVHAIYGNGDTASYNFDGEILDGYLPSRAHKLMRSWIRKHKEELEEAWKTTQQHKLPKKIKPLE